MSIVAKHSSTFLFTDIEGSTRLWSRASDAMAPAVQEQEHILRQVITDHGGSAFKTVGDGVYAVFPNASDAVRAAVGAQRALLDASWFGFEVPDTIAVRIAVHTGAAEQRDDDYFGPTLNRLSRTLAAGHGGQILCTGETVLACGEAWPEDIEARDLGERTLRDVPGSGRIFQLIADGLPEQFPPLATLDPRVHNLPRWPSPIVDRNAEAERLRAALRVPEIRMVTVLGTGGVGKTRLTTEVAAQLLDEYQHGIRFVDLSALRDAGQVVPAIAQATGANDPLLPATDAVLEWLRDRELLLVLDNCEQVVDGVAALCSEIVASAPNVTLLATSRTPIRIRGERQLSLDPLPLPGDESDLLVDNAAVALFAERAREVNESFALDTESADEIAEICRMVDGLPLAIELAAAWVRILSPVALQRRLQEGRGILRDGARDLPDRQRTLASTIAWSYDLLPPEDQRAFRRLAVFRGGIAVDAAAAVIWEAPVTDPFWALSRLDALVQANLLQVAPDPTSEPRFLMLQTIQEFAIGALRESGEWEGAALAHAEFFAELAALAEPHYRTKNVAQWLDRLALELENFRGAVEFTAADNKLVEQGLRMVVALSGFFDHAQARQWLELLYREDLPLPNDLRIAALLHTGNTWHSDPRVAGSFYQRAIALAEASDDQELRIRAVGSLSTVAVLSGDYETALSMARDVLEYGQQTSNIRYVAQGHYRLAYVSCEAGMFPQALAACALVRSFAHDIDDADGAAWGWVIEGRTFRRLGDPAQATAALDHAVRRFEVIGDDEVVALCELERGLAMLQAHSADAQAVLDRAAAGLTETNDAYTMISLIEGMAQVSSSLGHPTTGAELLGAASRLRAHTGIVASEADRAVLQHATEMTISELGNAAFEQQFERGMHRSPRSAIDLYLAPPRGNVDESALSKSPSNSHPNK